MRRAITLILALTVVCLSLGAWLDLLQRSTATRYIQSFEQVRSQVKAGQMEPAAALQSELTALWQHDAKWLNCLISHHHTRAVNTALLKLSTAMEMNWPTESLQALDEVYDALGDIESSDFLALDNLL